MMKNRKKGEEEGKKKKNIKRKKRRSQSRVPTTKSKMIGSMIAMRGKETKSLLVSAVA